MKPIGLNYREAEELVTVEKLEGLACLLGQTSSIENNILEKHVRWVTRAVNEGLRTEHRRPKSAVRRGKLKSAENRAKKLKEALLALDPETRKTLEDTASGEFGLPYDSTKSKANRKTPGEERFILWLFHLKDLQHALAKAADIPGKPGRPPYELIRWGAAALRIVWQYHTGSKPKLGYTPSKGTTGDFLTFCRAILGPIAQKWEIESDLERAVRDALMDETLDKDTWDKIHIVINELGITDR
jgi:hypothetical protein